MFEPGQQIPPIALAPITREQLRAYGEAASDPNPIHFDDAIARNAGLPGVIAHGMLSAAFLAERGLQFVNSASSGVKPAWRISRFQSRFRAMTFPGDVLSVGGRVKSVSPELLVLELEARNQKGELTTSGSATFSSKLASARDSRS